MKPLRRIEPTVVTKIDRRTVVIKTFERLDGAAHPFATWLAEGSRSGAVIALTKDNHVIISRQFRPGPEKVMEELPGGNIEDGEEPEAGIRRELKEETGYVPGTMELLGINSRDAYVNCKWYYYLALDCELSPDGPAHDADEQTQGLEVNLISIEQLIANAKNDLMSDAPAVLLAYERLQELMKGVA